MTHRPGFLHRSASSRRRFYALGGVLAAALLSSTGSSRAIGDPEARVTPIADRFYVVSEPTANMVLFIGEDTSFVAGVQRPSLVSAAKAFVQSHNAPPVRYALMLEDAGALTLGDGGWGQAGSVTLAHEDFLRPMRRLARGKDPTTPATAMQHELPRVGFSQVVQLWLKDEEIHIIHERTGHTDADVIVHFEKAGVLCLGNTLTTDGYPAIELARDGSLAGIIQTAGYFVRAFGKTPDRIEPIVPGRGPIATTQDLRDYADMLTAIRDRVQSLIKDGKTVEDAVAAKPTATFDDRWGHGPVTPDQFVAMVYQSLSKK